MTLAILIVLALFAAFALGWLARDVVDVQRRSGEIDLTRAAARGELRDLSGRRPW